VRYVVAVILFLVAALFQASFLPAFPIFGVVPNLVLVFAVCWTVIRGQQEAMIVVPIAGVCLGIFGDQPIGLAMLGMIPIVLLAGIEMLRLSSSNFALAVVLVFLTSILYEAMVLIAIRLEGGNVSWVFAFVRVIMPVALAGVLFTPPVYWLVRKASAGPQRIQAFV
jgi:rod shape-determining protein MreD